MSEFVALSYDLRLVLRKDISIRKFQRLLKLIDFKIRSTNTSYLPQNKNNRNQIGTTLIRKNNIIGYIH